jgi:uncharacterized protein YkwD
MRSLARFALTLAVSAAALLAPRPSHAQVPPDAVNIIVWQAYDIALVGELGALINDIRARNGLAPLTQVNEMYTAASNLANDMFQRGYASHIDSAGRDAGQRLTLVGYNFTSWGEIIGESYAVGDPKPLWGNGEMLNWWMNSPPHRANILNPNFTEFGGWVRSGWREEGGQLVYHRYWCVIFGSR